VPASYDRHLRLAARPGDRLRAIGLLLIQLLRAPARSPWSRRPAAAGGRRRKSARPGWPIRPSSLAAGTTPGDRLGSSMSRRGARADRDGWTSRSRSRVSDAVRLAMDVTRRRPWVLAGIPTTTDHVPRLGRPAQGLTIAMVRRMNEVYPRDQHAARRQVDLGPVVTHIP